MPIKLTSAQCVEKHQSSFNNILLVKESNHDLIGIEKLLEKFSKKIYYSNSLLDAEKICQINSFDLIIIDFNLVIVNELIIDLIKEIKKENITVKIIALCKNINEKDFFALKSAGFNEIIIKPLTFQKLSLVLKDQ